MIDALCVGAHPDDVEIGMGAAVATMVDEGLRVAICDLTDGEPTPRGSREMRLAEAEEAAEALGVSQRMVLGQPNRYLFDTVEARVELAEVMRRLRPRMVFAPYPLDAHPDHVAASALAEAARFYAKFTKTDMEGEPFYPPRLYRYAAVHLRLHLEPRFILDVTEGASRKMEALQRYASQFGGERGEALFDTLRRASAYWGGLIGADAGEPFFCDEEIGLVSFSALR